tara:strand:+ start:9627 stop:10088 length:462 start_codon:yes stop_codon:yes gene_type:complete
MSKKSKVKTVQGNGGGPGAFMDLYKYEVSMEDGTTGNMFKKTDNPFIEVGQEVHYTVNAKGTIKILPADGSTWEDKKANTEYAKVPTSPTPTSGLTRDELIVRQTCIKAAVDFCKNANCSPEEVTANAQIFRDWIFTEKLPVKTNGQTNDMPF